MEQDEELEGDIIPEHIAKRRGLDYQKTARGHICSAVVPHPVVIDQLLAAQVIDEKQHFYAVRFIAMRKSPYNRLRCVSIFQLGIVPISASSFATVSSVPLPTQNYRIRASSALATAAA